MRPNLFLKSIYLKWSSNKPLPLIKFHMSSSEDGKRAYRALLTLLDDGEQPKRQKKEMERDVKISAGVTHGDIEGYPSGEASDNDSDEEIVVDDDDEGNMEDPFETHFASPPVINTPEKWNARRIDFLGSKTQFLTPEPETFRPKVDSRLNFSDLKVKHRLQLPWARANGEFTPLQADLSSPFFSYKDILYSGRNWHNYEEIQRLWVLHIVNHIYKTRDRVIKNNLRINKGEEEEIRDQGFTRPKVLVILPTRQSAKRFVDTLAEVSGLGQIQNRKRFTDSFDGPSGGLESKPADFQKLFGGNTNDLFCMGIKFTRQALKLYSSFYTSDIIVGSPLGLRLIVGDEGDKKREWDFLSSIEICVVDQLDAIQMQSWDNLEILLQNLNKIPRDAHGCDFSRIRNWYLDDQARYLRQTLFFTEFTTPEMNHSFTKYSLNVAGKLRCRSKCEGILKTLGIHIRQLLIRLSPKNYAQDSNQRFEHFTQAILPSIMKTPDPQGILIVVPSYFDFVRVRNWLDHEDYSFAALSEYTPQGQISRGRTFFADGRTKIMLYSARLHHYRRYALKGVKQIVFYGLPDNPIFYKEIVRYLARTVVEQQVDPDMLKCEVLYSQWDALKLERIIGSDRVGQFIKGISDVYEIY